MNRGLAPLLVFLALGCQGLEAANLPVKRYAVFVGANQGGAAQQPLLYAQKDALKMQQVMQEVGGVSATDRILLLDPTPEEVRDALANLAGRMAASGGENRRVEFLFYYSGHSDEDGLLLGDRSLGYKTLRDELQSVPADVRIAILDSCSSGAFARLKGGVQRAPFLGQDSSQMKGHAFLTSSSENEASQESDTLQGSFFTHYLVSGLRGGADRAGDGLITLNEAYEYAFQNTLSRTESTRAGPQHPSYEIQLTGTGNLILSDVKASTARLEVGSDVVGKLYVRSLSGQLFAEVTKEAGSPLLLAFPAGTYTVTAVTPQKSLSSRVVLTNQGGSSLAARDFQEQELARFAVRGPSTETAPVDENLNVDLAPFGLGLVPDWRGPAWRNRNQTLALSALVDFANAIKGFQASGVISLNAGKLTGFQAAGVGSISRGEVAGMQYSGVFNIAGDGFQGIQLGGVFNLAGGSENGVWQSAGVFNVSKGQFRGIQTAGVVNVADALEGAQFSLLNIAGEVRGFQVGLVDINTHIEGSGFGLLFISPDAYYHPIVLYDNQGKTHGLFQWGMGWFYWLTGVVADPKTSSNRDWEQLGGVGVKVKNRFLFWDTDAGWSSIVHSNVLSGGRPYLRTTVGLQSGWAAVEAGVLMTPDDRGSSVSVGPLDLAWATRWYAGFRFF